MMKVHVYALAAACALILTACNGTVAAPPPGGPGPVDNCGPGPQPNGQPCR